jgi:hypothetical protein
MTNLSTVPTVITGIISVIIILGIIFSPVFSKEEKPYIFAMALVAIPLWFLVVYWFCGTGNLTIAWFFLILPFGIIFTWNIAKWLQNSCVRQ